MVKVKLVGFGSHSFYPSGRTAYQCNGDSYATNYRAGLFSKGTTWGGGDSESSFRVVLIGV